MADDTTYDENTEYRLPRGATENIRLDEQGAGIVEMIGNKPFHAPFTRKPKKILDVGCGTGSMTAMLGQMFPEAQVIGIDLAEAPIMDTKPQNVVFIQGDIRELTQPNAQHSTFEPGTFDYIYSRALVFGIVDWPSYISLIYRLLAPGGIYEIQEHTQRWYNREERVVSNDWLYTQELNAYLAETNHDPMAGFNAARYLKDAGFDVVSEEYFRWPLAPTPEWPESVKLGEFMWRTVPDFLVKAVRGTLELRLGKDRVDEIVETIFRDRENGLHGPGVHTKFAVVVSKKPD